MSTLSRAFVFGLLAAPLPAFAQSAVGNQLDEVVVTAQRRQESLQATPVSVTALTGATLEQRQVTNVLDVAVQVPNLSIDSVTGVGNAARVFLRGVGEDQSQFNADPAVGIYVDGVYYARTNGALFDFLDIERVEVLRGPQGTLYGRNTPGGAISVITKAPSNTFGLTGELTAGRFNQAEARVAVTGPLIKDVLAGSASFLVKKREGLARSSTSFARVNNRDVASGRLSLGWTPSQTFRARLTYDRTWDDGDSFVPTSNFLGRPADLFVTQSEIIPTAEFRSQGVSLNASWDLGAVTLASISAYRDLDQSGLLDNDGEARLISGFSFVAGQRQYSQELTASIDTGRFNGIAGFYFFDEYNTYDAVTLIGSRTLPTLTARPDASVQDTRSYALFGQASYEILQDLKITVGGRYTWDEKSFANTQPSVPAVFRAARDWTNFSPKVGVDYKINDNVFVYATYAEGYKAGGFNRSNARIVAETPYDQETVQSIEVGVKTDWFDRRLRVNLNGFSNDYTDLQLSSFDPNTGTTRRFNAASATTKGIELEIAARPVAGLNLYGTLGHLDAGYDRFLDQVGGRLTDVSFRKLKGAPELQYTAGFDYRYELAGGSSIGVAAEVNYKSDVFNNVANTPAIATDERTLVNASVRYSTPGDRWTITASGKNLTDEQYASNGIFIAGLLSALYPADPMTWSLSARFRY